VSLHDIQTFANKSTGREFTKAERDVSEVKVSITPKEQKKIPFRLKQYVFTAGKHSVFYYSSAFDHLNTRKFDCRGF